jgi:integrase
MLLTVEETKDNKVRCIPINRVLHEEFSKLKQSANHSCYVFLNSKTGRPITSIRTAFNPACRRAGLENFRLYGCRHTFASRLIQRGTDIETVRELLGHSDIRLTMRYAHSCDKVKRAAVEILEPKMSRSCDNSVTKAKIEKTCKFPNLLISMN